MLRERVGDLEPRSLGSDEDVLGGADAGIRIERSQRDFTQLSAHGNTEAGTADPAECPANARRSFISGQQLLAREPAKVFGADLSVGCEGRAVESPAHGTVAIADLGQWAVDFVTDPAAQTSASKTHVSRRSRAQSRNFQVLAPSNLRTRVDSITDGSKFRKLTPILRAARLMGCQCVAQPQ